VYNSLKKEEKEVMKRIKQVARKRKETTLLMSMPGIAEFSSLMILAEIGDILTFQITKRAGELRRALSWYIPICLH
jgi:transposase